MTTPVDYTKLRNATLDSAQEEEAVTVNTRALIDKVLARYSGEWTTLRELIQNAADASATKVVVRFDTLPSPTVPTPSSNDPSSHLKHTILHHTLRSLRVSNNGQPFVGSDWSRLKRIAEGNPDETKIGAFGVGFYSVFAECEEPFVASGKETMAFFWKGNSLFTRRGRLPDTSSNTETAFILDYRNNTTPVPSLISICQFLSSSLTFVGLENIELWLDDWKVFSLTKKSAPSSAIALPKEIQTTTKENTMRITAVESQTAQIDASWMNIVGWIPTNAPVTMQEDSKSSNAAPSLRSFFSRLAGNTASNASLRRAAKEEQAAQVAIQEDITGTSKASIFIRISTVQIKTSVSSSFATELERATKKPPPKTTRIAILTSSYDEQAASLSTIQGASSQKVAEVITSVLPNKAGRIFIGFPTAQTSGLLAHISAPSLIPTVERESIDLNARYVRTWNSELLCVAGIACRIAYIGEMNSISDRLKALTQSREKAAIHPDDVSKVLPAAVHVLRQYTFKESTPLAKTGSIIEEAFWTCNKKGTIEMLSSQGVLSSTNVRIASEDLSFVSGIPVVPDQLLKDADEFLGRIKSYGLISDITITDIKSELERQALTEAQLQEFLKWSAKKVKTGQYDGAVIQSLLNVTVANIVKDPAVENSGTELLVLANIKTFLNSSKIGPELPLPSDVISFRFTKSLAMADVQAFGWQELQIVPWLRWLVQPSTRTSLGQDLDITYSVAFSGQVLATLSKVFDSLSQGSKSTVVDLLTPLTIIPTKLGMRRPADSYFASVRLFDDLPTITGLNSVKEKLLKALGVRKTIELSVIFDRLMTSPTKCGAGSGSWSHVDLIRYLVSVWNDIPEQDMVQLRNTPLCPKQSTGSEAEASTQRYKMTELFEPKDSLRGLDLPLLQWPGTWNSFNNEGKFLKALGLRSHPSVPELIDRAAKAHRAQMYPLFEKLLTYYLDSHYTNNYASFDLSDVQVAFVPVENGNRSMIVKPQDCFSDPRASILGFKVLRRDLQSVANKLGVRQNPPMHDCAIHLIKNPPNDRLSARNLFSYFAGRLADIPNTVADRLGGAAIVPILVSNSKDLADRKYRMTTPASCFLGSGEEYGDVFDYVDFGEEANLFLLKIGSKHEPSTAELTRMVIREPSRILATLEMDRYMSLLRKINLNQTALKKDKVLWREMKISPFLLSFKEEPKNRESLRSNGDFVEPTENEIDDDVYASNKEAHLKKASNIAIVDDIKSYSLFKAHIYAAPQEEALESLYFELGSPLLSAMIQEEHRLGPRAGDQKLAETFRELFLERAQLFLHDQPASAIRHNIKWFQSNLEVQVVQSVSLRRTLKDTMYTYTEKMSAALTSKTMLFITRNYEPFHVCNEVVNLLLTRPRPQDSMALEMFLNSTLSRLRSRGYNVDRVLRKQELQRAKIAEQEEQRKQEEQQKRERERQELAVRTAAIKETAGDQRVRGEASTNDKLPKPPAHPHMPGAFENSPDRPGNPMIPPLQARNFFSNLTKKLGFDTTSLENDQAAAPANGFQQETPKPGRSLEAMPYSDKTKRASYDPNGVRHTHGSSETVTNPSALTQNLQAAINASKSWSRNSVFSKPTTDVVKEITDYCDSRPGTNLTLVSTTATGIQVFVSKDLAENPADFVASNNTGIQNFGVLLMDCAQVFNISISTIHIFYDPTSRSIAFNSNGSLFCNYRFFAQLHHAGMTDLQARGQATVYWWVTMCHELAHNLVSNHGSDHSFYTEAFTMEYFPAMMSLLARMAAAERDGQSQQGQQGRAQIEAPPAYHSGVDGQEQEGIAKYFS